MTSPRLEEDFQCTRARSARAWRSPRSVSVAVEEAGITFFDTAEVYGPYVNEELVGEALAPLRERVVIATKFGWNIQDGRMVGTNSRPEQIRRVTVSTSTEFAEADIRNTIPRFEAGNIDANEALVGHVRSLAEAKSTTPGQIALAWLLAQQPWIAPIPGTRRRSRSRSRSRIDENAAATQIALSADEIADLDDLPAHIGIRGNRYNPAGMAMVGL